MRRVILAAIVMTCAAPAAFAQTDRELSPLALAVGCAPPPTFETPSAEALRIIGTQDSSPRALFGNRDLLVIGGGTSAGEGVVVSTSHRMALTRVTRARDAVFIGDYIALRK